MAPESPLEFDPDSAHANEVRFIPDGSSRTRVELEHRLSSEVGGKALHTGVNSEGAGLASWQALQGRLSGSPDKHA